MQAIWNNRNQENLFVIDEAALHARIKRKGRSVNRLLGLTEWIMILVNLAVGILLLVDGLLDGDQAYWWIFPAAYLAFFAIAVIRRLARRQQEMRFEETIVGEVDKAIWRVDYLIKQGRSMIVWYVLPLLLLFAVMALYNSKLIWAAAVMLVALPLAYFGGRWEINKWYLPKKQELEGLREALVASQAP